MDPVSLVSAYRAHNISHVLGKTTDVINKLLRPELPYRRYYSHIAVDLLSWIGVLVVVIRA